MCILLFANVLPLRVFYEASVLTSHVVSNFDVADEESWIPEQMSVYVVSPHHPLLARSCSFE